MKKCSEVMEMISLYLDDQMPPEERSAFEEHIRSCVNCKKELDALSFIADICRETEEAELPENFRAELHKKLLEAKEQEEGKSKVVLFRSKYVKIFSSVAAGILLLFLARSFYYYGGLVPSRTGSGAGNVSMKAEMPFKASAQDNAAASDNAGSDATAESGAAMVAAAPSPEQTGKAEIDRSSSATNRDQTPKVAFALQAETAQSTMVNLTVLVDDPASQVENIKAIMTQNGGRGNYDTKTGTGGELKVEAADSGSETVLQLLIPNIQYEAFLESLSSSYGKENIQNSVPVNKDLSGELDSMVQKSNALDSEMKNLEDKNDENSKNQLDDLKAEKDKLDGDIEKIRLGTDFCSVTLTLKKK